MANARGQAGPFREPVAGNDRVWLQDTPDNLMVINSVFTIDRLEDEEIDVLRQLWHERVMEAGDGRYARFRRRIVFEGRRAFWQDDPDFDLARHIVVAPPVLDDPEALSTRDALQAYIGEEASKPLPEDRPRWQFQVVPRYRECSSAVYVRVHHVMGDGLALLPVVFALMDFDRAEVRKMAESMARQVGKSMGFLTAVGASLAAPFLFLQKVVWKKDRSPIHGSPLSGSKRVSWTDPVSLDLLKKIKDATGAKMNDVLMSAITGAFERYVASHPGERLSQLRASMPVNVRPMNQMPEMNNKFAAVLLPLEVGHGGVRERLEATKARMEKVKRSVEPLFTYGAATLMLKTLPWRWSHGLIDFLAGKCSCVISNVPGPPGVMHVAGKRVHGILFWVPQRADIGVGVSMISYSGELLIGIIADTAVIADPRGWVRAFHEELDELRASVGV